MTSPRAFAPAATCRITLHQPWASLIALGLKRFETRSWPTQYRGSLLIHAAKRRPSDQEMGIFWRALQLVGWDPLALGHPLYPGVALGQILAICEVVECWATADLGEEVTELERGVGCWDPGRFAWELWEVRPVIPVACRGYQRIWRPSDGICRGLVQMG